MKKIQILPNLFTTGNLCCGFLSILFVFRGEILTACGLILIANLFDILDGKIARLTKSITSFGVQFDSLSDLVSFGIAPATLVYAYLFQHAYHRLALIIFCLYVACGALRLARFNVQVKSSTEKKYFTGLPIPAAGSLIASFILVVSSYQLVIPKVPLMIAIIVLSYLMISTIAYHIFVFETTRNKRSFSYLVTIILGISFIAISPEIIIFIILLLFAFSGPFYLLRKTLAAYFKKYSILIRKS